MENIREFLRNEISNIAFAKISDDELIIETKVLDSISMIDLAVSIEQKFGISISNREINEDNFGSINKIAVFVEYKKGK